MRRAMGWGFRLLKEAERSTSAYFFTLSYDDESVKRTKNGFLTLEKKDFQDFMKRLRHCQEKKIKYYAVGEYGDRFMRPHYHFIVFNLHLDNILSKKDRIGIKMGLIPLDGKYKMFIDEWKKGYITIGRLTIKSAMYTLKYVSKVNRIPMHERDDRIPEFSLMSKGIGSNYLNERTIKWHKADIYNRMYIPFENKKLAMPRYFREKIYTNWQVQRVVKHIMDQQVTEYQKKPKEKILKEAKEKFANQVKKVNKFAKDNNFKNESKKFMVGYADSWAKEFRSIANNSRSDNES